MLNHNSLYNVDISVELLTTSIASKKKPGHAQEVFMSNVLPPLCRYCGKPIGKRTKTIMFGGSEGANRDSDWLATRAEKPRTREEVQRLVNQTLVSVRYVGKNEDERYIHQASVWDGVSYKDDYFCSTDHAEHFAYAVVQSPDNTLSTQAYRDALDAQAQKFKEN
jgi:hypothetical protein